MPNDAKENLCIHTAISIQRAKFNKNVSYPVSLANKIENTFKYTVAKEIVEQIYEQVKTNLPCVEVYYIAQCIVKILPGYELTDKVVENVDFILTTV